MSAAPILHNVSDRIVGWIGPWEVAPFILEELRPEDAGRAVIYDDGRGAMGSRERGILSSWSDERVWVRFSKGDTAALCDPAQLHFGLRSVSALELRR